MGDFDDSFIQALKVQSWSLYGVGIFIILLRLYARAWRLGVQNYELDDYLQILVAGLYTALIVCLNVIAGGGGSNLYPPEMAGTFTPEEIEERIYGSKIVVVSEQAMLNVIYTIKACMLIMYTRLTLNLTTQRLVQYLSVYVFLGWLASEIAFFAACRPFSGYWGMPPPDPQCTTLEHYAMVQGCFNISSDVLMLAISLPLVARMNAPWRQKVIVVFIFGMGAFVVVAALLTKIFNLTDVWDPSYMLWYVREASVAVYVSNLPLIWPLLRDTFPCLRTLSSSTATAGRGTSGSASRSRTMMTTTATTGAGKRGAPRAGGGTMALSRMQGPPNATAQRLGSSSSSLDLTYDLEMGRKESGRGAGGSSDGSSRMGMSVLDDSSSTEHIVAPANPSKRASLRAQPVAGPMGGIQVERTVTVAAEQTPAAGRGSVLEHRQHVPDGFEWEPAAGRGRHVAGAVGQAR